MVTAQTNLNLTRDQLASFLGDHELIKQFETLFALVKSIAPDMTQATAIDAGNAKAEANENTSQILRMAQDSAINSGNAEQKAVQALDLISGFIRQFSTIIEMLSLAPIKNNVELSHDVNGILPYENQTQRVRSNQVVTWLSI